VTLLLVDVGNTRVKWARLVDGRMGKQQAAANAGWDAQDYARRVIGRGWDRAPNAAAGEEATRDAEGGPIPLTGDRIVVSSVAGSEAVKLLVAAARRAEAPKPEFVASQRSAAGVTTAYLDPWRLGVDRFVAAIGAHHLAAGKPVCVVNVGTAITIDLVDASGEHRGGAIVPGPALMVDSLLRQTNGIRRRATGGPSGTTGIFARTTRAAVTQGARYAAAAVIDRALEEARQELKTAPLALLTGGGSAAVKPLIRSACVRVPDLVLHGLAVWASHAAPQIPRAHASRKRRLLI
jgi:type III pantothenate kinase